MSKKQININGFKLLLALFKLALRYPSLWLAVIAIGGAGYFYEIKIARPSLLYQGEPLAISAKNFDTWFRVLRNQGFILGYSDLRGNPLWVEYALTAPKEDRAPLKRPSRFETDWRSINRVSHDSYKQSGYDRGHMAPNYAISRLYGRTGQLDTFLMTNISPQKTNLNQKVWQRLEEVEIDYFAKTFGKIWVVTGPVFTGTVERLDSDWTVEIPDAFYKIFITDVGPNTRPAALGFVVPQTVSGKEPLTQFLTAVDDIEAQTGLDFFAGLSDDIETALEAKVDSLPWNLQTVSRLPSRY